MQTSLLNISLRASFIACAGFFLATIPAHAGISGTNTDEVKVKVEAKQGGEWITARTEDTDDDGVLVLKDALPGKYRFTIDKDDITTGQTLGLEIRLLDESGRRTNDERLDVDVYVYIGDTKVLAASTQSDKDGWVDLTGITSGTVYELDVKDDAKLKSKDDRPRIKMKAKISGSDWFRAAYNRVQKDGWLEVENILPGKYKFKYKSKDVADINAPFNLHAKFRNEDGEKVKNAKVKLYAYPFGIKTFVAELKTDKKGWIQIPGVVPGIKYKVSVKD